MADMHGTTLPPKKLARRPQFTGFSVGLDRRSSTDRFVLTGKQLQFLHVDCRTHCWFSHRLQNGLVELQSAQHAVARIMVPVCKDTTPMSETVFVRDHRIADAA
jgi:hypothetical protein